MGIVKNNVLIISIITAWALLTGCGSRDAILCVHTKNPTPLFRDKGDIFAELSGGPLKVQLTTGAAFANSFAAYIGAGTAFSKISNNDFLFKPVSYTEYRYNGSNFNFGAGYFVNRDLSQDWRFEVFGDYGSGQFFNQNTVNFSSTSYGVYPPPKVFDLNGSYKKIGLLLNIGHTDPYDHYTTFAYSARVSRISFSNMYISDSVYWKKELKQFSSSPTHIMLEHGLTIKWGENGNAKYHAYIGLSHYAGNTQLQQVNVSLMLGVFLNTNIFQEIRDERFDE